MIVLNLRCANLHRFEGWFASGEEFTLQSDKRLVSCPVCGSQEICKLPAGPRVRRAARRDEASRAAASAARGGAAQTVAMLVEQLLLASEDVGERFPEEARLIHHDEAPARNIRGVATREEVAELRDEGILVLSLPVPPKNALH
ncbi:MAG: DUF1178 family protein [Rhodocyclaceae bacterium]